MQKIARLVVRLGHFNRVVSGAGVVIGALFVATMTTVVLVGVFFRYVLNDSITWVEDVSLILMVSMAFVIAPYAFRSGANVAIEFLIDWLPGVVLRTLRIVINVLVLWVLYRYVFESFALVNRGWGIRINSVPMAWGWVYLIVPVAFFSLIMVTFELVLRDLLTFFGVGQDLDLPHMRLR